MVFVRVRWIVHAVVTAAAVIVFQLCFVVCITMFPARPQVWTPPVGQQDHVHITPAPPTYVRLRFIALDKLHIPVYYLDTEYTREDVGQMKTRVEAFLEMLAARVDF